MKLKSSLLFLKQFCRKARRKGTYLKYLSGHLWILIFSGSFSVSGVPQIGSKRPPTCALTLTSSCPLLRLDYVHHLTHQATEMLPRGR